jgi:PAS domain S-box-containing protein
MGKGDKKKFNNKKNTIESGALPTLLIVEDDEGLNRLTHKNLKREGFYTEGVFNGRDAIARVIDNPDVLLLLDYLLPDMTGKELIETLIEKQCSVPFIIITGQGDEKIAVEMMKLGAREYIRKDTGFLDILPQVVNKVFKDLNKEKMLIETEEALRESEERFRAIFETAEDSIFIKDSNLKYTQVNPAMEKLFGLPASELIGMTDEDLFGEEIGAYTKEVDSRVLGGEIIEMEHAKPVKGELKTFLVSKVPVRNSSGDIIGLFGIARDITERRKMEREIEERKTYLERVLISEPDAVVTHDAEGRVVEWNPGAERLFGYKRKEVIGKAIDDLIAGPDPERYRGATSIRERFLAGESIDSFETIRYRKDGSPVDVILSGSGIVMEDKLIGAVAVYKDISERKTAEEEKEKLRSQLLQAQKMEAVGRLAGGIAHDFNNLLTAIMGYTELLSSEFHPDDPRREDVKEILNAGKQASLLTRQLLTFSRRQIVQPEELNVNSIVTEVENILRHLIGEDIELVTVLDRDPGWIKADPGQMEQVIVNLAVNARDAMPDGGKLTIKTENITLGKKECALIPESKPGKFVCLWVEDTGVGMDKEIVADIFEPFFTTKESGTGLGLSVVYGIVKQHEGWIDVESSPGRGSTFRVYLPLVSAKGEARVKDKISVGDFRGDGEGILLVEDEDLVREFSSKVLRRNGYVVYEAGNIGEAFNIFEKEKENIRLVFSDVVLPDGNGIQLVEQLLSRKEGLRALLCSGYTDEKSKSTLIKRGEFHFIQKPYSAGDLLKAVKETLRASK